MSLIILDLAIIIVILVGTICMI